MDEKIMLKAKAEAQRFLDAVEQVERQGYHNPGFNGRPFYTGPKQTGALKRASMDLTRTLADLRRRTP